MIYTRPLWIFLLAVCLLSGAAVSYGAEITICSWNVANLGKSKTPEQVSFMAGLLCACDVIALQEVNVSPDGAQQTAALVLELNNSCGAQWDYSISPPTTSPNAQERERYVYIWKSSVVQAKGKGWLDTLWQEELVREPYIMDFRHGSKVLTLVNFHAVPKKKDPAKELAFFKGYPSRLKAYPFIILGDFNLPVSHNVFEPLKRMGYRPALQSQRTTLRQECLPDGCLANAYDNFILHPSGFKMRQGAAVHFYTLLDNDMKRARAVSDHLPITMTISIL